MTRRIFRSICIVAACIFLAALFVISGIIYKHFAANQREMLRIQTELAARAAETEGDDFFSELDRELRITHIAADGTVLYDTHSLLPSELENHLDREEVAEALEVGWGESVRYSSTLTSRQMYCAKLLDDGSVIRISVSQTTVILLLARSLYPILIIAALAVVLALILSYNLSKLIVKPLNELNLEEPLSNEGYDELSPLLRRIDAQQRRIKSHELELTKRRNEFNTVTRHMGEGLVLLNANGMILSINRAAERLLGITGSCKGKSLISVIRTIDIHELIKTASEGETAKSVVELSGSHYQLSARPVITDGEVNGIVMLIFDITEKERTEQLRREFTANVSHELKTPLHTISGCAELLTSGMVKPEDTAQFAEQIYFEARRMIQLVEDIIRLSHLDEGASDMKQEPKNLKELAASTLDSLSPAAESAEVSLSLTGDSPTLICIPQLVSGIIFNLCDNAIKYNRKGGSVKVEISDRTDGIYLAVSDTGIGIPEEHRERIFERFYRVDKSHSKEVGGTGLGLSIVKHAAKIHNADITLESTVGKGTTVTVIFPK